MALPVTTPASFAEGDDICVLCAAVEPDEVQYPVDQNEGLQ